MRLLARLAVAAALLIGCEGPSVPSVVDGEPVCKDFKQANETLKGGLKHPEDARLRLGMAQLQSAKTKAAATQTLRSVKGNDSLHTYNLLGDPSMPYRLPAGAKPAAAAPAATPRD